MTEVEIRIASALLDADLAPAHINWLGDIIRRGPPGEFGQHTPAEKLNYSERKHLMRLGWCYRHKVSGEIAALAALGGGAN